MKTCIAANLLVLGFTLAYCSAQEPNRSQTDIAMADQCRSILESSLVDFYLPESLDRQHGGYFEILDTNGRFAASEKFSTLQARQLWFFSSLAMADIRKDQALSAAKSGYEFLSKHFLDRVHGGYFAKTEPDGEPSDRRKHVYPNAFVIYAMVQYHLASGDAKPLQLAMELFATLERHAYDRKNGGYREFFYEDWQPVADPSESSYIGAVGTKTYNSHLHLLEAFTSLYRATHDPIVAKRLNELVMINTATVKLPGYPCNVDAWTEDWKVVQTEQNYRASYGHDVECAWLVLDAIDALDMKSQSLHSWATALCDHAIERGFDHDHGGFYYSGPVGKPSDDRRKEWWTQSEALVAMLWMYQLTEEAKYQKVFDDTFAFIKDHQIAASGGWWSTLEPDGSVAKNAVRTSMWQGGYHNGRALLMCEQMLRKGIR